MALPESVNHSCKIAYSEWRLARPEAHCDETPANHRRAGAAWLGKICRHAAFSYDKLLVVRHLRLQEVPFVSGLSRSEG